MNKIIFALSAVLAVTLLAGCEVTGPHVRLKPPITVEGEHHHHDHYDGDYDDDHDGHHKGDKNGDFCPPGQAKKGRC